MACLDSTILVELLREQRRDRPGAATKKLEELDGAGETATTTIVNYAELMSGAYSSSRGLKEVTDIENLFASLTVLGLDEAAARQYGKSDAALRERGETIGAMDLLIGAIAVVNRQSVVTRNVKDFARVRGLGVIPY